MEKLPPHLHLYVYRRSGMWGCERSVITRTGQCTGILVLIHLCASQAPQVSKALASYNHIRRGALFIEVPKPLVFFSFFFFFFVPQTNGVDTWYPRVHTTCMCTFVVWGPGFGPQATSPFSSPHACRFTGVTRFPRGQLGCVFTRLQVHVQEGPERI